MLVCCKCLMFVCMIVVCVSCFIVISSTVSVCMWRFLVLSPFGESGRILNYHRDLLGAPVRGPLTVSCYFLILQNVYKNEAK